MPYISTKKINTLIIFLASFPFLLWCALGGHKQQIFGINSDHTITLYSVFIAFIVFFMQIYKKNVNLIALKILALLFFLYFIFLLSDLLNPNFIDSFSAKIILLHMSYGMIIISLILIYEKRPALFIKLSRTCLILAIIILALSALLLGLGSWGRLTVPVFTQNQWAYFPNGYTSSSDPNVLAYLLILFAIYLFYNTKKSNKKIISSILFFIIIFLIKSRSAIIALMITIFILNFKWNIRFRLNNTIFLTLLITISSFTVYFYFSEKFSDVISVIINRINDPTSNSDRINRLSLAIDQLDYFTVWIIGNGPGYSARISDPHNFYVSTITDTGVISLIIILLIPIYLIFSLKSNKKFFKCGLSLLSFFLIISLFYWQVRTYYVLLLLLGMLNITLKRNNQ